MNSRLRIGHGYDVHRFAEGSFITLGGVRIAHHSGLLAHSDGDVLLHALCDALLGAAALGARARRYTAAERAVGGAGRRALRGAQKKRRAEARLSHP